MESLIFKLVMALALASVMGFAFRLVTSRKLSRLAEGTKIDVDAWRSWSDGGGHSFSGSDERPMISGAVKDVPFRLACEIRNLRVNSRKLQQDQKIARTQIRVAMRSSLPSDLFIHPMPRTARLLNRLLGGKTITTTPEIDALVTVETSEPDKARAILLHDKVLPQLLRVLEVLPEAVIDSRSVDGVFPSMPTVSTALDRYVETLADFVLAVQEVAPGEAIEAPYVPASPTDEPKKVLSSAQLPQRRPILAHSLAKVSRDPLDEASLYISPMEYEVQVSHHIPGVDERNRKTGGLAVVGDIARSVWRIELLFDEEDTPMVEALERSSFIEGMLEVLSCDVRRKRIVARSITPPMPSANPPKGDA
ncbi:MAG: hypothetical protein KC912_07155 [Proteobacteria bacterium]|nr:hypothetical protein [Pseudomonadota bacterium]